MTNLAEDQTSLHQHLQGRILNATFVGLLQLRCFSSNLVQPSKGHCSCNIGGI